jgi:hypothetical protein
MKLNFLHRVVIVISRHIQPDYAYHPIVGILQKAASGAALLGLVI